jgi:hypothetical protein
MVPHDSDGARTGPTGTQGSHDSDSASAGRGQAIGAARMGQNWPFGPNCVFPFPFSFSFHFLFYF